MKSSAFKRTPVFQNCLQCLQIESLLEAERSPGPVAAISVDASLLSYIASSPEFLGEMQLILKEQPCLRSMQSALQTHFNEKSRKIRQQI